MKQTRIGKNKGNPRVWLEGAVLINAGITRGMRFDVAFYDGLLVIRMNGNGKRKVSGKGDKPIIDIASSELLKVGPIGSTLTIFDDFRWGLLLSTEAGLDDVITCDVCGWASMRGDESNCSTCGECENCCACEVAE